MRIPEDLQYAVIEELSFPNSNVTSGVEATVYLPYIPIDLGKL